AEESDKPTNEEIAKELANPNTALTSLKFQFQYFSFEGDLPRADEQDMFRIFLQPVLPFPLESGKTVWVRPGIPLVFDQPVFDEGSRRIGTADGLGDMTLDVQYGAILEDGFLWSVGFSSLFPTATKRELSSEQWTLGPGFQLGYVLEKSIYAVFVNHQWDIAGDGKSSPDLPYFRQADTDEAGISLTTIQPFGIFLPGDGWTFGTAPIMTYNHESEEWMIPVNLTVGKTVTINGRPWDFSVDINYYVDRPDLIAPEWMISFNVAPVIKNIFADWFDG
ncbi:MAG: hypothetical protein ACYTCN_09075, partial [Planctomycetota bacterium]